METVVLRRWRDQNKNLVLSNELALRQRSKCQLSKSFTVVIQPLSTRLIKPNFCFDH